MKKAPTTYRACDVTMVLAGSHIASGFAEDSFISIAPEGGGNTIRVGADGEIVRDQDTTRVFKISLSFLHGSDTYQWLFDRFQQDKQSGDGMFDVMIKDLSGVNKTFNGRYCCVENISNVEYTKNAPSHAFTILVSEGKYQ